MKKIILLLILTVITTTLLAEDNYYYNKLKYSQFAEWVQSINIRDYQLESIEKKGAEDTYNIEYLAMFGNMYNESISIRIGHPNIFYHYEDLKAYEIVGPYDFEGLKSVYVYSKKSTKPFNMTYYYVELRELHATFSITALTFERSSKEMLEGITKLFRLNTIEKKGLFSWPVEIPIPFRLSGDIISISKSDSEEEHVKYEYHIKFSKTDTFIKDLELFYNDKKAWLDFAVFKDFILICKTSETLKALEDMKTGEGIEFIYYVKKNE